MCVHKVNKVYDILTK